MACKVCAVIIVILFVFAMPLIQSEFGPWVMRMLVKHTLG